MKNITFKNNIQVSIDINNLIKEITSFDNEDKVFLISEVLDRFNANIESPLQALSKHMYSKCIKEGDNFKRLSEDEFWKKIGVADGYGEVSKKYYKEAEIWKQFIDEKID